MLPTVFCVYIFLLLSTSWFCSCDRVLCWIQFKQDKEKLVYVHSLTYSSSKKMEEKVNDSWDLWCDTEESHLASSQRLKTNWELGHKRLLRFSFWVVRSGSFMTLLNQKENFFCPYFNLANILQWLVPPWSWSGMGEIIHSECVYFSYSHSGREMLSIDPPV